MEEGKWKPVSSPFGVAGSRGEVRQVAVPRRPLIQRFPQADIWPVWLSVVQLPWFSFRIARHPGFIQVEHRE
jgi:hypothetical protein